MNTPKDLDGGRFEDWPLSEIIGQCRMQSRDNFDPAFSQFMAEVANRLSDHKSAVSKIKTVEPSELSLLYRTAYMNHVRSILTMGEREVSPSIHFAASDFAAAEVRARLIDEIESGANAAADSPALCTEASPTRTDNTIGDGND